MTTLCIDTATEFGTVVVVRQDVALASVRWRSKGRHGENLLGHIDAALAEAGASRDEISLVGVDVGPGRFTSLRVGLGTAKGIAYGLGVPIVGVSSLRVLARAIDADPTDVRVPVMNAYRGDVFAAAYRIGEGPVEELASPLFGSPTEVFRTIRDEAAGRQLILGGEGVAPHAATAEAMLGVRLDDAQRSLEAPTPEAIVAEVRYVYRVAGASDLDSLEPSYLRPSDAKLPKEPLKIDTPA